MICNLWSETIFSGNAKINSIDLSIYDGPKSLLLNWIFPDTVQSKETKIFRKSGSGGEFELVANFLESKSENNKYLDNSCKNSIRYFYYVEIVDGLGNIYKSDNLRPSFGALKRPTKVLLKSYNDLWELFVTVLNNSILKSNPESNYEHIHAITNLLSKQGGNKNTWVDNYPTQYLNGAKRIIENQDANYFDNNFLDQFQKYEELHRNQFLLTPSEWDLELKSNFMFAKEKWFLLKDSFEDYKKIIGSLPPAFILAAEKGFDDKNEVKLLIVNLEALAQTKVNLSHFGESIEVDFSNTLASKTVISISTPNDWDFVKLNIDDLEVDKIDFINKMKVMKTVAQEIVLTDKPHLTMSKENSEIWLNELYWNPITSNISVEVAGIYTGLNRYIISIDGEEIWSLDLTPSFDMQYIDSTFNLKLDSMIDNVMEFKIKGENNNSRSLEVVKLLKSESISNHRFPDGETWRKASKNSFGSKNIDKKTMMDSSLIPELFVLYQNYPNPFNGNTRISFDLLQDATLSLYVTDATGRIKTIFSDQEFYNSGKYSFDWNAEIFSTGVYFFTINAEVDGYSSVVFSRKMIYLK
ncbi:MAG: T9SS type A sorting domain-containing protein [Candidatus Neomarinimicrobiota bacterium]